MYKIGFIGYGSMGSMFLKGFINSGAIEPGNIIVSTRTKSKLEEIKAAWEDVRIAEDNSEVARKAEHIFLCVKPDQIIHVLKEIKDCIALDTHIISTAGPVKMESIEKITGGKVSKLTPSLTSEVCEGISLICHNEKVTGEDACFIEDLLKHIGSVKTLSENAFELAAEITSCGPGLAAALFEEFVNSAVRHAHGISESEAVDLVRKMLFGTSRLLSEKSMSFKEAKTRVATKGGITEEGIKVLTSGLPQLFDGMFESMLNKRILLEQTVNKDFNTL